MKKDIKSKKATPASQLLHYFGPVNHVELKDIVQRRVKPGQKVIVRFSPEHNAIGVVEELHSRFIRIRTNIGYFICVHNSDVMKIRAI